MKKISLLILLFYLAFGSFAQPTDLSTLDDQFNNPATLQQWKLLYQVEGWPDKLNIVAIENDQLIMEPGTSGWFADLQAPFIYKEVKGDFDVRTRIRASGKTGNLSQTLWSLGGLMARVPKATTKDNWRPKEETWLFINTGVAQEAGKAVIESKYTINSKSSLKLREGKADWITLRLIRIGNSFVSLYRYDSDTQWTVQDRYYIADLPEVMQIGFQCYTNSEAVSPQIRFGDPFKFNSTTYAMPDREDMRLAVDYVTFKRPLIHFRGNDPMQNWLNNVSKNNLTDYNISNEKLLQLVGD